MAYAVGDLVLVPFGTDARSQVARVVAVHLDGSISVQKWVDNRGSWTATMFRVAGNFPAADRKDIRVRRALDIPIRHRARKRRSP